MALHPHRHLRIPVGAILALAFAALALAFHPTSSDAAGSLPAIGMTHATGLPASWNGRWDLSYGYDDALGKLVLFGGSPKDYMEGWHNDTWLFDGSAWSAGPVAPAGLKARGGAAMAYLPSTSKVVLFGGMGADWPPYNDTWLFDGNSWSLGPAAPAALKGRTGAGMVYDPDIAKLVLLGGSGVDAYNDTWLFDGTNWTQGPAAPAGMGPRTYPAMAYDPVLHKVVTAGGDGGTDVWYFDGTSWTAGPAMTSAMGNRERFPLVYDPDLGGDLLFGGLGPGSPTSDMYLLRDGKWTQIKTWTGNEGWPGPRLGTGMAWLPTKDAMVIFAGIKGSSSGVNAYTDAWMFRDNAPQLSSVTVAPSAPAPNAELTVTTTASGGYQTLTYDYSWYVNGAKVAGATDRTFTAPATPGATVVSKVKVTDGIGLVSAWTSSNTVAVTNYATLSGGSASPGQTTFISGGGYAPNEPVDIRIDNATTGLLMGTATANATGNFNNIQVTIPNPFPGAGHTIYGTGRTSGLLGIGTLTVLPSSSLNPVNVTAGDLTTLSGFGFVPGETVSVSFPGGTPAPATADANGSVSVTLASPPEPYPGGVVTASAPSGTTTDPFNTSSRFNVPQTTSEPGQTIPVTLTGYGASETVSFTIDGTQVSTGTTDASGSLSANVPMTAYFGTNRKLAATGVASAVTNLVNVSLPAFVTVTPGGGGPGTQLQISSGPGWPLGDLVTATWGTKTIAVLIADLNGKVSTTYSVPSNASGTVTVKLTDLLLGLAPSYQFVVSDAAPKIGSATVSPSKLYTASTATAVANSVSDPDGDTLTYHYAWTVNGSPAGTDAATLPPTAFTAGSSVAVTITVVDPYGLSAQATSSAVVAAWNLSPLRTGTPGLSLGVKGNGYAASETVVIHLDSATGPQIGTATADATGSFASATVTLPSPLGGGVHGLVGVGQSSGIPGTGQITVVSTASINPVNLAAGDLTTFSGLGFVPGENVSVSFPGQTPTTKAADANGSVSLSLASPAEPAPGGNLTAAAPSGTLLIAYNTSSRFNVPQTTSEPGQTIPVTLTGYGASETVSFTIDGTQVSTGTTDASGSLSANVPMTAYFGTNRKLAATGVASAVTNLVNVSLPAFVTVTPGTGPPGTPLTIVSGPGWPTTDSVTATWGTTQIAVLSPDASGKVSTTYSVPSNASGTVTVKLTDLLLGLAPSYQFVVSDAAPKIGSATVSPSKLYTASTATAVANSVSDPDGDTLTYHYAWTVNGSPAGTDAATLPPTAFTAGSSVAVTITVVDPYGLSAQATSSAVVAAWNLSPLRTGTPGLSLGVKGNGYAASETVVIHLDSATGPQIGTATADATGSFASATVTLPSPLGGGVHGLVGVGQSSGIPGTGQITVVSTASINPVNLAAGDLTTFSGLGFVPGENVSVSFPGQTPTTKAADANGSVSLSLASPAEPAPGGNLTAAAPSGTLLIAYNTSSRFNVPQTTSEPGQTIPVTLTGYGASETVSFTIDGTQVSTGTTDASGSLSANVPMTAYFGTSHTLGARGTVSGVSLSSALSLPAFVYLAPSSGPVGTVVTITSGPGWIPGEKVHVYWMSSKVADVTADASGKISYLYVIPTHSPGSVNIKLTDDTLGVQPVAPFQVT